MNKQDFEDIIAKFKDFSNESGYPPKTPIGLLSPAFPHEFNISAGHDYSLEIFNNPEPISTPAKFSLIDTCFRRIDIENVGYSNHLSLFNIALFAIGGILDVVRKSAKESLTTFLNLLVNVFNIPKERLLITVFGGWEERGIPSEDGLMLYNAWRSAGISESNLLLVEGRRNFFLAQNTICAGPTCEIFFDRGESVENAGGERFIEIGSVNWYRYVEKNAQLLNPINSIFVCAIGIERVLLSVQKSRTIFHIESIRKIIDSIYESFKRPEIEGRLYEPSVRTITDSIRSASFITSEGIKPDSSSRGKILKKLIKGFTRQAKYLNIYSYDFVKSLTEVIIDTYYRLYPKLEQNKEEIIETLTGRNYGN